MALKGNDLAEELANALDEDEVSDRLKGWASAVVTEVTSGFATIGGVPGPHPILGLLGPRLAILIAKEAGYPIVTPQLLAYATSITIYIMSSGVVTYKSPPPSPAGNPDWFVGGTISGMTGPPLAVMIATALGYPKPSEQLLKKSAAIVDYIQANGEVENGAIS